MNACYKQVLPACPQVLQWNCGALASARNTPATTRTGLVVQVPEYLAPNQMIKVNTLTKVIRFGTTLPPASCLTDHGQQAPQQPPRAGYRRRGAS